MGRLLCVSQKSALALETALGFAALVLTIVGLMRQMADPTTTQASFDNVDQHSDFGVAVCGSQGIWKNGSFAAGDSLLQLVLVVGNEKADGDDNLFNGVLAGAPVAFGGQTVAQLLTIGAIPNNKTITPAEMAIGVHKTFTVVNRDTLCFLFSGNTLLPSTARRAIRGSRG